MIKVSVIIPVYNAEEYIEKTIKSLILQTLSDIEIILVNDGSKDNSLNILRKYEEKYDNVKVIDQRNSGPSAARNSGIRIAKGEYIAFVDSDDYTTNDMFENLYNKAKENDFDIVECNFMYTDGQKTWNGINDLSKDVFTFNGKKQYMIKMYPVLWNKIYKRNKIKDILFTEGIFAEDVEYLYRVLPYIENIGYVNKIGYYYYQRSNSESNSYGKKIYDYITNFNNLVIYYKDKGFYDKYKNVLEYCYVRYLYATFIKRAITFDKNDYLEALNKAIKNVKEKFPNYRLNKYFYKNIKGMYLVLFNKHIGKILYNIFHR